MTGQNGNLGLYLCDVCRSGRHTRVISLIDKEPRLALCFLKCFGNTPPFSSVPARACERCFTRLYNFRSLMRKLCKTRSPSNLYAIMHQTTPTPEEKCFYVQSEETKTEDVPGVTEQEVATLSDDASVQIAAEGSTCTHEYTCTCESCQSKYGCLPLLLQGIEEQSKNLPSTSSSPSTSSQQEPHQSKRTMKCQYCDKSFTHKGDFNKHLRIHTKEQPYTCTVCSKKFAHSSNLQRHVRLHSGQRPFVCDKCGKSFARKDKLDYHKKSRTCLLGSGMHVG